MDYILVKFANFLIAICVASMVALTLGFVAHYHYGLSRLDIRTSALTGAAPDLWGRFHLADPASAPMGFHEPYVSSSKLF